MQQFYYSFGGQMYCELERPEIVAKPGAKMEVVAKKYTLLIKPAVTRVVIMA